MIAKDQTARQRLPAALITLAVPSALWGGALVSEYVFGLAPCEMCYWQRWPHQAAIILALFSLALLGRPVGKALIVIAALAITVSGVIGVFHAGVEYGWWEGLTACSTTASGPIDILSAELSPLIRCDQAQWTLAGISLAGFNAIFSLGGAALAMVLLRRAERSA